MFELLFQNLFNIHRHTQLLEVFSWDEEALKNYTDSLSIAMNEAECKSIDEVMNLCLNEAEPFLVEFNKNLLKEFLEEEFSGTLREITSNKTIMEN